MSETRRVVLIQGAFDLLHLAHARTFAFAKSHGEYLIVALNTNKLIGEYKRRMAVMPWSHKRELIASFRDVDEVIPAPDFSPIRLLKKHNVDVYVVCEEWVETKKSEIAYMEAKGGRVVVAPRFTKFSTTTIKARLLEEHLSAIKQRTVPRRPWEHPAFDHPELAHT